MPICFDCLEGRCYSEHPPECGDYLTAFCCMDNGYSYTNSIGEEYPPNKHMEPTKGKLSEIER